MFYDNFEKLCREQGTSPSAVTMKIGKSRSVAAAWKKNGTIPSQNDLKKLAKVLDCSVSDFFDDHVEYVIHRNKELRREELMSEARLKRSSEPRKLLVKTNNPAQSERSANRTEGASTIKDNADEAIFVGTPPTRIDEYIRDFISIYKAATPRQRHQLMSAVYDFEEKVLNNDGD